MNQSLMETQLISPECRTGRTTEGAWDEAVRRLREIYDVQVAHDPAVTIGLSISRVTDPLAALSAHLTAPARAGDTSGEEGL